MKKIILMVPFVLLILIGCKNITQESAPEPLVYFSNETNLSMKMIQLIDLAESEVHCALYDLNIDEIINKLDEKNKKIDVKLVLDDENALKKEYVRQDKSGLMHDKFCVIDNEVTLTGSYNPTKGSIGDDNNIIILFSKSIAKQYDSEFEEMWQGTYKGGQRNKIEKTIINNQTYKALFCPEDLCEQNVIKEIDKANRSIKFMTFSFTSKEIADKLTQKKKEGINIIGVVDKQQAAGEYSKHTLLKQDGIKVEEDKSKGLLHHKVFIIDDKTVITGSYNPTTNGDERNDENVLIINNPNIAKQYITEFNRLIK